MRYLEYVREHFEFRMHKQCQRRIAGIHTRLIYTPHQNFTVFLVLLERSYFYVYK